MMATPKDGNPLWILRTLYFVPCHLMYQRMMALKPIFFSTSTQAAENVGEEFMAYTLYWFAGLFVVAEGWKELDFHESTIDSLLDQHWDSLRVFRNGVFHFQMSDRKHVQFFDQDKFNWAERLHHALKDFFEAQDA